MNNELKKTIKMGIIFILIVILIIVLLDILYIHFVIENKEEYAYDRLFKDYFMNKSNKQVDFIFFGSSHTVYGMNTEFIPNSLNFGSLGARYIHIYYRFINFFNSKHFDLKVDYLVLEVDNVLFFKAGFDPAFLNTNNIRLYHQYMNFNEIKEFYNWSSLKIMTYNYLPFIGNGKEFTKLENFKDNKSRSINLPRWEERHWNANLKNRTFAAEQEFGEQFPNKYPYHEDNFISFKKILKSAKENNVKVILIRYPISKELHDVISRNNITLDSFNQSVIKATNSILGDNYTMLDYYYLYANQSRLFADSDHLNYFGAKYLALKFYEDVRKLGLIN